MAAISTPENLAKLDRWKEITHKLRDPRADARRRGPQAGQGRQGHRPHHLLAPRDRDRRLADVDGAGLRPRHRQDLLRRREGPQRRHRPPRPDPQPRRQPDGRRLVQEIRRDPVRGRQHALALPLLCRPRQQPRLVHVQPARDAGRDQGPLPRLAAPDPRRRAPAGLQRRPALRPAVHGPAPAEHPALGLARRQPRRHRDELRPPEARHERHRQRPLATRPGGSGPATTPPGSTTSSASSARRPRSASPAPSSSSRTRSRPASSRSGWTSSTPGPAAGGGCATSSTTSSSCPRA